MASCHTYTIGNLLNLFTEHALQVVLLYNNFIKEPPDEHIFVPGTAQPKTTPNHKQKPHNYCIENTTVWYGIPLQQAVPM